MLDGRLVIVDIDTQRDFLDPSGALYVPGSRDIRPNLERLTRFALSRAIPILATACAHMPDDPEFARFPPHCLVGSAGQERIRETACEQTVVLDVDDRLSGEIPPHLTLHKREFDVFSRSDADALVKRYKLAGTTFVVYGVATDYCVRAAVEGLLARGCQVAAVTDAVRAIDPGIEAGMLSDWARRGVRLTNTAAVCRPP
jgi:nicotinamidase/pyrazinamidase